MIRHPVIELAKTIHQAIGIDSPRAFILVFALFGAISCGTLEWMIDRGYRVSLRTTETTQRVEERREVEVPHEASPHTNRRNPKLSVPKPPPQAGHDDWLTDTQKSKITDLLIQRASAKGQVAIVRIGSPIPKYADQIAEAIHDAGWPLSILNIGSASFVGGGQFPGNLFVAGPRLDAPSLRAVSDALAYGDIAAPIDASFPSLMPASESCPDGQSLFWLKNPDFLSPE